MSASGRKPLILFFLAVFPGAMVLGPLLYFACAGHLAFHRAMDRALLICAVASLVLFRSNISLRKLWPFDSAGGMQFLWGWAAALVSAQAIIGAHLVFVNLASSHLPAGAVAARFLEALAAALIVPLLEETLFRGFFQTEMIARFGSRWGWLLTAFIFALAHFLKTPATFDHQPVHLWSGISALVAAFEAIRDQFFPATGTDFFSLTKGFNIFLLGLILGATFLRCGTLWFNAGLHGGLVFVLLLSTGLTHPVKPPPLAWVPGDIVSSPLTSVVLILLSLWLWLFYQPHFAKSGNGENAP
ncbi:MAG TPA: CPBP family intramembrane glutamic endopeptidase [Candidatus Methylacidiphilales bacterium]|nr:CPBP family intramembrane glutamic endopeptidase [Candidatus Methylacidiphilales bacterium]